MAAAHDKPSNDKQVVPSESAFEWVTEDPEIESSMEMEEDELEFEAFDETASDVDDKAAKAAAARDLVPLWRLIEMSREDRSLRMELADFEDYDDFDQLEGEYAGSLSH